MKKIIYLLLFAFLLCAGPGYAKGFWPGEVTPDPPPEVVPPVPPPVTPPPVQTTTTEHGQKKAYAAETNWHFSKPIAQYGKFDLFIGDKKYVVSMAYKDSQVEVRNSNSTGKLVVIAPASFRDKAARISYPSTGQPTPPPVEPEPQPGLSTHYDHWRATATAWNGPALILCPDSPRFQSCLFNGEPMRLHGKDEGRWVWAQYTKPGRGGTIVCDGTTRFEVQGGRERQDGDCR